MSAARLQLLAGIRSYFKANEISTKVDFGVRARTLQINQGTGGANRVVVVPGRFPAFDADGVFEGPTHTGGNPRQLVSQKLVTTISLWAAAPNAENRDEERLEQAIDDMKRNVVSAIQAALMHAVEWNSNRYNPNPFEQRFGVEYLIEIAISGAYHALEEAVVVTPTPIVNRGRETYPLP